MPTRTITLTAIEDALIDRAATIRETTAEALIAAMVRDRLQGLIEERRQRATDRVAAQWATLTEPQRRAIEQVID